MRYVVTGGSGFIGTHLVRALQERDSEIVVIDKIANYRNLNGIENFPNTKYYFADLSDPLITEKIIQEDDIVFHLAAQSHVDVAFLHPLETTKSNVLGTQSILNACLVNNVKKLIVMSTDEVYGSVQKIENCNLLDPTNPYSASKAAADMIVNSYKHMYEDMSIVTLRSNNIVGPGQFIRNIVPRFSCLGILGKKMTLHGSGQSRRRYLWVEDAVKALLLLSDKALKNKIYNIGHNKEYTNLEVANMIGEYLGLSDFISYEPDRVFNDSVYPCDFSEIQKDLGWEISKDLEDSLPQIIDWYKTNIKLFESFL
ncbi:NAD-dependent epimerase/dehydratase family protein [Gammaproteobacteria bacterium]|nr:NAD-dependent epimerase/dehydratase family protein [Gammaproteobacteria bacterium]